MSDFIFVKNPVKKGFLTQKLQEIYRDIPIKASEYHCQYGCIAYRENIYNGFNEYETEDFLCIIIGGPLLDFRDNRFISIIGGNEGTKAIFHRWKIENQINWDKDLNGPFIIICLNKKNGNLEIVTDLLSFIPVYSFKSESNLILSSHINTISRIENVQIDQVSIIDFILHKVITFPYTIFKEIIQLEPASIYHYKLKEDLKSSQLIYWEPKELDSNNKELALRLRRGFKKCMDTIVDSGAKIGTLLSGGEDSRCVLSAIPYVYPKESFMFVDRINYEVKIACKVAKRLNSKFNIHFRDSQHYLNILEPASDLIGPCGDFTHAHSYGINEKLKLIDFDIILGGFLSDTLLKGHHIHTRKFNKYLNFLPIPETPYNHNELKPIKQNIFKIDLVETLNSRRKTHYNRIKKLRPKSALEWFNIWPITMHLDYPNVHVNRRLFKSYEPFTFSEVVKVCSEASNNYKLNRRLFREAMKPFYIKTIWIPHVNGSFPFFPWYLNKTLKFLESIRKRAILILFNHSTECSFSDWNELLKMQKAKDIENKYSSHIKKIGNNIFLDELNCDIINSSDFTVDEKRIIIQLGYHLMKQDENKKIN